MRVACLVIGYSGAPVLGRSAATLKAAGFDIYLHIDRKGDRAGYIRTLGPAAELCTILENPVEVYWGGFSMVRAELLLIESARAVADYDKYILISDDTFPVLPADRLAAHFDTAEDHVTIRHQEAGSPFYERYHGFFCYDHPATTIRTPPMPNPRDAGRGIDRDLEDRIADIAFLRRAGKKNIDVYYGPQFWALTRSTVDLVRKIVAEDILLVKSFEYSALPDEMFFQSIIGNYGGKPYMETAPVYSDFSGGGPRMVSSIEKLPLDLSPSHAFLRKVSPSATEFLDQISERLRQGQTILGTKGDTDSSAMVWTDSHGVKVLTYRLGAPADQRQVEGWHGIEVSWGRQFRWSGVADLQWAVRIPQSDASRVRFLIATAVSSGKEWMAGCAIKVGDVIKPLIVEGGELFADFEGLNASEMLVYVETPPPREPPAGYKDQRRLGLAVTV